MSGLRQLDEDLELVAIEALRAVKARNGSLRDAGHAAANAVLEALYNIGAPPPPAPTAAPGADLVLVPRSVLERAYGVLNTASCGYIVPARLAADVAIALRVGLET